MVLQTLNPTHLLGGRMAVRQDLARAAIERLASTLGMDAMATAQGIISVVTANMARAIRVISVQRGHDPRDYTLVAFGGAGPLHAARLAQELEIGRILVPRNPGILCAMGLLLTDLRADFAATRLQHAVDRRVAGHRPMRSPRCAAQADAWFAAEGIAPDARRITRTVDMRYAGQNYELPVPLPDGAIGPATLDALAEGFAAAHRAAVRLHRRRTSRCSSSPSASRRPGWCARRRSSRSPTRTRRLGRDRRAARGLAARGGRLRALSGLSTATGCAPATASPGPPIVEQMDATTVVLPGMIARVEPYLNLILEAG